MITRQAIVDAARSYLGCRFRHQGRNRAGLDCSGLIVCVARDLGIKTDADIAGYPRRFGGEAMKCALDAALSPVASYQPGDVLLMRFDQVPQHLAIATDYGMIHSYLMARRVVEHRIDEQWAARIVGAYAFPGVTP